MEDFIIASIGTNIMILVPVKYSKGEWSTCIEKCFECYIGNVSF